MAAPVDDTQLTAYALGELPDAARSEMHEAVVARPEVQEQVAEIKSVASTLNSALQTEHTGPLSARRMLTVAAEVQRTSQRRRATPSRWINFRMAALAGAAAVVLCAVMLALAWASTPHYRNVTAANNLLRRLESALAQYQADFHQLPPDTGYGLPVADVERGAGRTYDAGSLWRYLGQELQVGGKSYGPYMRFRHAELAAYSDPVHGKSFYVADPWGTAIGYIGDPRRVIHNRGSFDLFSAGPDRKTGQDMALQNGVNAAYDGKDNDGDGVIDNAGELGGARLNGCLTVACNEIQVSKEELDDLNNWDR